MLVTSKGKAKTIEELIDARIGALVDALESGHSDVLTAYLSAMAKVPLLQLLVTFFS